jgi:hypothetical protein
VPAFLRVIALAFAKTFSKLFGIATITFFGRVPSRDDDKVAFVGLASITWLATIPGLIHPPLIELVVPFLPDDEALLRGIAAALVIGIPPVNGYIVTRVHNADGGLRNVLKHLVIGYGYTTAIGFLVLGLVLVVPVVKASHLVRRYDLRDMAVMIAPDAYDEIVEEVQRTITDAGYETEITHPNPAIRRLFIGLVWMEERIFCRTGHVAHEMRSIRGEVEGDPFEVIVHATDITVVGRSRETSTIYALLAEQLDHPSMYFSWDDASQEVEDEVRRLRRRVAEGESLPADEVAAVRDRLREMQLSTEEWNAIRRLIYRLQLERARAAAPEDALEPIR